MNEQNSISFCVLHLWLFHEHQRYLECQQRIQINIIKMCIVIWLSLGRFSFTDQPIHLSETVCNGSTFVGIIGAVI